MTQLSGECLCGAAKYSSEAEPLSTVICHCEDCQRQSGSAFSVCVVIPNGTLIFEDRQALGEYVSKSAEGTNVRRIFCKNCGSPILSLMESAPELAVIKAGTLNDKSWLEPSAEYWCERALPLIASGGDIPKFERNPT